MRGMEGRKVKMGSSFIDINKKGCEKLQGIMNKI